MGEKVMRAFASRGPFGTGTCAWRPIRNDDKCATIGALTQADVETDPSPTNTADCMAGKIEIQRDQCSAIDALIRLKET